MQNNARLASVRRFAQTVDLSERTIWKLIAAKTIPVVRVGRRTLIRVPIALAALERMAPSEPCFRDRQSS